jgi:hypothetical protein
MRWLFRKAKIDSELRETFEQYGVGTMQMLLATTNYFQHKGRDIMAQQVRTDLLPWLTEQYDRAETKETWSMTMEFLITVFVLIEILSSVIHFFKCILF